ncbi:SCO3374 family protein [Streptomyces sp. NPDC059999]|uniref:SCO3374 family protein n=1 Tax=Streptomyces sp. NPDC059999 TaxID=3347030 RepID=UPI0036D123F3
MAHNAETVPQPRSPSEEDAYVSWYGRVLGWTLAGGPPAQLVTGTRFDVLELPTDAGGRLLRRPVDTGPVAVMGRRMRFLVAPGSAEELDGLLDWLEWGPVALDLTALGAGGRITAPVPPGRPQGSPRGAAVWLRPPEQGCEAFLPSLSGTGQGAGAGRRSTGPDLVRLVAAAATECHRARLRRRAAPARPVGAVGQPRFS